MCLAACCLLSSMCILMFTVTRVTVCAASVSSCLHIAILGRGEVGVYRGTSVSRGVRPTTWERSLKNGSSKSLCFDDFFWEREHFGTRPCSHFGMHLYVVHPHFPSPNSLNSNHSAYSGLFLALSIPISLCMSVFLCFCLSPARACTP